MCPRTTLLTQCSKKYSSYAKEECPCLSLKPFQREVLNISPNLSNFSSNVEIKALQGLGFIDGSTTLLIFTVFAQHCRSNRFLSALAVCSQYLKLTTIGFGSRSRLSSLWFETATGFGTILSLNFSLIIRTTTASNDTTMIEKHVLEPMTVCYFRPGNFLALAW